MSTIITALTSRATRSAKTGHRRAGMTRSGRELVPAGVAAPRGQVPRRRRGPGRERRPRTPAGRSHRRTALALAAAALAALALAIMGSGTALAAPPSPRAAAATRAIAGPLPSTADAATTAHKKAAATPATSALRDVSPASWMGERQPQLWARPLADIVIPGSHDSLTYSFPSGLITTPFAQTQDEDIADQLDGGIREFDIRVGWHKDLGNGWGYYAQHGGLYSSWLKLPSVLTTIEQWATTPGRGHEIILVNLTIDQANNTGPFPSGDCQNFGAALGTTPGHPGALVTPSELSQYFGTTDPGKVTLGQLWSLPDPNGDARVILDNTQCMAAADPAAGQWGSFSPAGQTLFSGYYANQCTANGFANFFDPVDQRDGIQYLVMEAGRTRATQGDGGEPVALGLPKVGGFYNLQVAGTPQADCPLAPGNMVPDEQQVLNTLFTQWFQDPKLRQNVNIISADYVDDVNLWEDAVRMDSTYPVAPDTVTRVGAGQVTMTSGLTTGNSVPASAFAARASYQGIDMANPGFEVDYQISGPLPGPLFGFNLPGQDSHVQTVTSYYGDANPEGLSLFPPVNGATGTWTVTASVPGGTTKATWTVVVKPGTAHDDLKYLGGNCNPATAQVGQTYTCNNTSSSQFSFYMFLGSAQDAPLPNVPVTIDAGSAGTFNGLKTWTGVTNTDGLVLAPPFTAGTSAGTFPITVNAGDAPTVSVPFTITPGPATTFVATQGGGQATSINTTFPVALQGHWTDQYGNTVTDPPAADRELTLSPSSAATWPGGQSSAQAAVAADGTITAPDLTAGHTVLDGPDAAHSLTVQAGPASGWTLDVTPGAPATVTATSGDGQQTGAGKPFAKDLAVKVTDAAGNPVPGTVVTFQVTTGQATFPVPPGAAAYFGRKLTDAPPTGAVVVTGSDGIATAPVLTAGQQGGPIEVTASAGPASATKTTVFHLSVPGAPAAPAITGVTLGDGQATVAFSDAGTGTDPITSYTVSATDKNQPEAAPVTATGPASPVTVKGLTNGDPYVFTVTATSAAGTSPPSAAYGPLNVGVAPVIVSGPANGTVNVPYSSGFTVTGAPPPTISQVSGNLPPGLVPHDNGTLTGTPTQAGTYTFTVQAANPVGADDATVTVVILPAT